MDPSPRRIVHSSRAFRPSVVAAAFALLTVAACSSDKATKGADHSTPAAIAISSGDNQVGTTNAALASPIAARVTNSQGNPLAGQSVAFTVTRGSGSVSSGTVTTDNNGVAQTTWTLGAGAVRQQVAATVGSLKQIATATVDTTRSLYLMAKHDTVSANDTIWLDVIAQTTGLGGETRGAVQESFVNNNPSAAQLVRIFYSRDELLNYSGTNSNLNILTSGPTNASPRQLYLQLGYIATRSGQDIQFDHTASGFVAARTFTDLLNRVSVVGTVVHVR